MDRFLYDDIFIWQEMISPWALFPNEIVSCLETGHGEIPRTDCSHEKHRPTGRVGRCFLVRATGLETCTSAPFFLECEVY